MKEKQEFEAIFLGKNLQAFSVSEMNKNIFLFYLKKSASCVWECDENFYLQSLDGKSRYDPWLLVVSWIIFSHFLPKFTLVNHDVELSILLGEKYNERGRSNWVQKIFMKMRHRFFNRV